MGLLPMARKIQAPANPDPNVALHIIQEFLQGPDSSRPTKQPAVHANAHHFGAKKMLCSKKQILMSRNGNFSYFNLGSMHKRSRGLTRFPCKNMIVSNMRIVYIFSRKI
jgi:hypothetical protein